MNPLRSLRKYILDNTRPRRVRPPPVLHWLQDRRRQSTQRPESVRLRRTESETDITYQSQTREIRVTFQSSGERVTRVYSLKSFTQRVDGSSLDARDRILRVSCNRMNLMVDGCLMRDGRSVCTILTRWDYRCRLKHIALPTSSGD